MSARRVYVTDHAVEQYRSRHAPHLGVATARFELEELAQRALNTKACTPQGDPIWQADAVPMVIRYDRQYREDIVVTVLPASCQRGVVSDPDAEIRAEYEAERQSRIGTL